MKNVRIIFTILVSILFAGSSLHADGKKTFNKKCGACHTIQKGGSSMGPNLYQIAQEREEDYLKIYMTTPEAGRKKYPDIYKELAKKYPMKMPSVKLSEEEINEIYEALK